MYKFSNICSINYIFSREQNNILHQASNSLIVIGSKHLKKRECLISCVSIILKNNVTSVLFFKLG